MDKVLHSFLQAPPLEVDCDQLVGTHSVLGVQQLFLMGEETAQE